MNLLKESIMKRRARFGSIVIRTVLSAVLVSAVSGCLARSARQSDTGEPFTIVALPDTQLYSLRHPKIFIGQTEWIKGERDSLNIVGVVHEGDITHKNTEAEWVVADEAMSVLDGVVPYYLAVGNHDMKLAKPRGDRDSKLFRKHFPVSRFERESWYGGHFGGGMENAFYYLDAGGMKFLVICLEIGPTDDALDWANRVLSEHKEYRTIVLTHIYTYLDDTRVGEGDKWHPRSYGNDGEQIWEKFVRKHENIFLVLSGHVLGDGLGRLTSVGDHGNRVHQVLANYQMKANGGNGWLRIMTFVPKEDKITVRTYSPYLDEYATDEDNQFELEYGMKQM